MREMWRRELEELAEAGLRRRLRHVAGAQGPRLDLDGVSVVNLSSNNYLGLASSTALRDAAVAATREAGTGAGASRLISGNMTEHEALERELAGFHGAADALLFNSGYQANVGVLPVVVGRDGAVFSDALNHASLIDGCRLARAEVSVFAHGDLDQLAAMLAASTAERKLIVTDSVFSMDGDWADLVGLRALADEHGAGLMVDEAHAVGVLGPGGRGVSAALGVEPDVLVGTLGKAFGSFGAYVVGARELRELLLNRARSFVFTTALPPGVAAASRAGLGVAAGPTGDNLRRRLGLRIEQLRAGLERLGLLSPGAGRSPVFPIVIGDAGRTMECCEALLQRGLFAQGIRPPTVPRGTSRLRVALMATHQSEDVARLVEALAELQRVGLVPEAAK